MMTVYGNAWNQRSAGQWYRVRIPLIAMQRLKLARAFIDDPFQDGTLRQQMAFTSNVQVHMLVGGKMIHQQILALKGVPPSPDEWGNIQHPPTFVFDMDDDIESVSPLNPKFATLGTRDANGNLLDPRTDMGIEMGDGEPVYLWKHGAMTVHGEFNAGRNIAQHANVRKMAATCDAITCTSETLKQKAAKWNPRVYVYPNCLLFDEFQSLDIRRPADDVRVMWQGGYSHFPDFYPLRGAFSESARRMPQIKWVVFGTLFPWVYEKISQFRVEYHPWVSHELFHMKLATLSPDINIAPLADTPFNRCKSAIKFYEAAALSIPTLAQNCGPYATDIIDGDTGYLFSTPQEFVEKLERLVLDKDHRVKIGQRASEWVHEHRDAMKEVPKLAAFYRNLVRECRGYEVAA